MSPNPNLRKRKVLKRLIECALSDDLVTESTLANELFGLSPVEFHPDTNPYVRVHMSLLRKRLSLIYAEGPASERTAQAPSARFAVAQANLLAPVSSGTLCCADTHFYESSNSYLILPIKA